MKPTTWLTPILTCAALLLVGGLALRAAPRPAAGTATLALTPPGYSVAVGERVTATLRITGAEALGGWELEIAFDSRYVELEAITPGDFLAATGRTTGQLGPTGGTPGRAAMGGYSHGAGDGVSGAGDLAYLRFRGVAEGQGALTLSAALLAAVQGITVTQQPAITAGGQITVYIPAAAPLVTPDAAGGGPTTLRWTHDARNSGYQVWRSATAHFTPGAGGTTPLASGLPPSPNCTQAGALITCSDPAGSGVGATFYIIRALNTSGAYWADALPVGRFGFALQPGE